MTNKQKIINGVDVSGCIFYSLTTMGYVGYNYCKCFECVCECHNNCYYKRLKRKEQEWCKLFNCLKQANGKRYAYKQALDEIENYCKECNLKADFTACEVLDIIDKIEK